MITNTQSGTNVHEIAAGIYRINTPVAHARARAVQLQPVPGARRRADVVPHRAARTVPVGERGHRTLMPIERLRYVGFSHFEADECGALNQFLAVAPQAIPVCGQVAAHGFSKRLCRSRAARAGGRRGARPRPPRLRWFDTPHVPHAWECGLMMDMTTRTFFCGDLFTQGGGGDDALTESDILGPSEAFRAPMDYFAHAPQTVGVLERLAREAPTTLAVMHGSAWRGDGAGLLRELGRNLQRI